MIAMAAYVIFNEASDVSEMAMWVRRQKLVPVQSTVDGLRYFVRSTSNGQDAADMLARVKAKMKAVLLEMKRRARIETDLPDEIRRGVLRALERHEDGRRIEIHELNPDEVPHLAINNSKGRSVFVCLAKSRGVNGLMTDSTSTKALGESKLDLGNEDVVLFISLHELAHSMTRDYDPLGTNGSTDHSDAFFRQEAFVMKIAQDLGLLDPSSIPGRTHCGTKVYHPHYSSLSPPSEATDSSD